MVEKFCREFEIDKSMLDVIVENVNNMMNNKIQRQKEEEEKNKKMMEEMKKDEKNGQPQKVEVIKDYFSADK